MILVAGGTGFIGSAIVRALRTRGEAVAVMSRSADATIQPGVSIRAGDVLRPETLPAAIAGCETVINAVQFPNYPTENKSKGFTFEEVDQHGTERLVAAAKAAGARRFIYISGVGAAPDAAKHWFRAKWAAEAAVKDSGLTYTILRPSWVYGPDDHALNRLVGFARRLPFVPVIGNGEQRLQPVFVDDVAASVSASLGHPAAENHVFEVGGPQVLTMNEIVRMVLQVLGKQKPLIHAPAAIMELAASVAGLLPNAPLSPEIVSFATTDAVTGAGAVQELEQALGVQLTLLRAGLASYLSP